MNINYSNLKLKKIIRYLSAKKWVQIRHPNHHILFYQSPAPTEEATFITLPSSENYSDYETRIQFAIDGIANHETRSNTEIASLILKWDIDILRSRFYERHRNIDSLPFKTTLQIVENLKDFLGGAAYSEVDPKKYFPKAGSASKEFVSNCRFGHTFQGSFGLSIECPLPNIGQTMIEGVDKVIPFERLVFERIAKGYKDLKTAIDSDSPDILINNYNIGFNANLLNSLTSIYERLDALCVDYSIDWAPELYPNEQAILQTPIRFDGKAYELSKYAAKQLESEADLDVTTIISRITNLKSELPPSEQEQTLTDHIISLSWEKNAGNFVGLKVALPPSDYKLACDAHKDGRHIIITGRPRKEGKFWILDVPSHISFTA